MLKTKALKVGFFLVYGLLMYTWGSQVVQNSQEIWLTYVSLYH